MKVIILAGGLGSRLGNITEAIPKPMLRVGGKPILWHIMKAYSHYGHRDFMISLGYKSEVIKEYFINYELYNSDFAAELGAKKFTTISRSDEHDWKVQLIDTGLNTLKGARIKRMERFLDDEINMVTYGDGVADIDIAELVNLHKKSGKTVTITGVRPPSRFGEIIEKDGELLSFEEKPQVSSGLINGGFMVFNRRFLDHLSLDENCDLEYGAFNKLAKKREIAVYKHKGQWECVDTERDLRYLNKLWDEGMAFWKVWK